MTQWYFYLVIRNDQPDRVTYMNWYGEGALKGMIVLTNLGYTVIKCKNLSDYD